MRAIGVVLATVLATEPGRSVTGRQDPSAGPGPFAADARAALAEHGVHVGAGVLVDWSAPLAGGVRARDTVRGLADLSLELDASRWPGRWPVRARVALHHFAGRDGSLDVGDFQVFDNIDAPHGTWLAESWVEVAPWDGRLRIQVGKIDANTDFAVLSSAVDFVHSSAGFPPTIVALPSYPDPAFGAVLKASFAGGGYARFGAFDGALGEGVRTGPRGLGTLLGTHGPRAGFFVLELGGEADGGHVALGAFRHTATFPRFGGGLENGTSGLYALAETRLVGGGTHDSGPGVDLFVNGGIADGDVWAVRWHALAGVRVTRLFAARPHDALGLLVSHVDLSDAPAAGRRHDETAFELHYLARFGPHVFAQPCLHVILDPGGRTSEDAVVALLRVGIRL